MKLLRRSVSLKDQRFEVALLPENSEDLWHAYNLIDKGDLVRTTTWRKVALAGATEQRASARHTERVRLVLTIRVQRIDYDAEAPSLRIQGKNVSENEYVKREQHHTLEITTGLRFDLIKSQFDRVHLRTLETACDPSKSADIAICVMEEGLAHLCLVSGTATLLRARIQQHVPSKLQRAATAFDVRDKALERFFEAVMRALLQQVNLEQVRCVVIASPGYVREQFLQYLFAEAARRDLRSILEHKRQFIAVAAGSGRMQAVHEVLASPETMTLINDTKAAANQRLLQTFYEQIHQDSDRALYGPDQVERAAQMGAVEHLLITDALFRHREVSERKRFVALVDQVESARGQVHLFSSAHATGQQLADIGGIAALLRFPWIDTDDDAQDTDTSDIETRCNAESTATSW
jgi:protein pelota